MIKLIEHIDQDNAKYWTLECPDCQTRIVQVGDNEAKRFYNHETAQWQLDYEFSPACECSTEVDEDIVTMAEQEFFGYAGGAR